MSLAVIVAACSDFSNPTQAPIQELYTTPTGLVTSNPPEIFVGAGDISTCSNNNDEATAKLLDNIPGTVFVLGDNVYPNGTTSEYNNCYAPTWGRHKARTKPSAGNHDYNTSGATGYYNYFGAAAGDPSKGYYSFNLGAWHVVVLNSNISKSSSSAQTTWLRNDLAANQNLCTVAYFHHPLYSSSGGTGSGGVTYSSVRPFYDALYAGGADLVLAGHRHFYERLGRMKPDGTRDNVYGTRHIIAGMGGIGGGSVSNKFPTSEVGNGDTRGVLKLYLYEDSYAWKFIPVAGKTFTDSGSTACHPVPGSPPPPPPGVSASLSTVSAAPATVTAGSGTATITVTARNANGQPVSNATVTLASSGSLNTLTQPGPTDANGVATGSIRSTVAQPKIVSAIINNVGITQTDTVTVVPDVPAELFFAAQPSTTAAGAAITPAVQVAVHDQFGNRVTDATNSVALAISTNPGNGTLSGTTPVAAVGGLATFSDLSIDAAATGYRLRATATGLSQVTSATFEITIAEPNQPPVANFTVSCTGLACSFTNTSTDPDGTVASYAWTFGDGGTSTLQSPSHTYGAGGDYTVTLTVTDNAGAESAPASQTVTATPPPPNQPPVANFTVNCSGLGCSFTNTSTDPDGTVASYEWTFGDGGTSTIQSPSHTYGAGGNYTVTLTVTDNAGAASAPASLTVTVTSPPPGTISHTLLTAGNNVVNVSTYQTATISPAPNTLVTVAVLSRRSGGASPTPVVTGGGMAAWTVVGTVTFDSVTALERRLTVYRAMSASPGSGPLTITFAGAQSNAQWTVSQWDGVEITGTNGADAIAQVGSARGDDVTGLSVPLAALANANNVAYGAFGVNKNTLAVTPGPGFTEISEHASGESQASDLQAEWAVNLNTITASWATSRAGALGLEIKRKT
ncbi:MAG TPA: PKD domain-containing protein [Gemmatimonadales bacterium]|nr:PKD domain-containing protein [Gemmatimonadales bacterium]